MAGNGNYTVFLVHCAVAMMQNAKWSGDVLPYMAINISLLCILSQRCMSGTGADYN